MDVIEIVKFGITIATFLIMIGGFIAGIWAFRKVTENHLAHMDIDIQEIMGAVKENTKSISILSNTVSYFKGILDKKE